MWSGRVREWRASGVSMSEFSRGKDFTAAGLSYWVRRLATESAPSPKRVRLARVVRTQREVGSRQKPDTSRSESATRYLVIEAGALRVHVPELLERTQLEALLVSVGRAAKAGGE
jgi:hypothetical protein